MNDSVRALIHALRETPWAGPGPVIREIRQARGLLLKNLAEITGLSIGYISRLERTEAGGDNPSLANLEIIARALEIPLSLLLPPDAEKSVKQEEIGETLAGRAALLAITYDQPITMPMILRKCSKAGTRDELEAALKRLIAKKIIRQLFPDDPSKPIYYVIVKHGELV